MTLPCFREAGECLGMCRLKWTVKDGKTGLTSQNANEDQEDTDSMNVEKTQAMYWQTLGIP